MSVILLLKRNDKQTAPGNEAYGVKHGDPVDIIDDSDPVWKGKTAEEIISGKGNHEAYLPIQVDPKKVEFFKSLLVAQNGNASKEQYRPRIKRMNIARLANLCNVPDLDTKMHSGDSLPIINGLLLDENHFDDATLLDNSIKFRDVRAISTGTATVGTAGTYATLVLAYADLANLTGNLTFTVISAIVSTSQADITEDLGGFAFITTSSIDPLANPIRNGNLITVTSNTGVFFNRAVGNGIFIQEKLFMTRTTPALSTVRPLIYCRQASANITYNSRNCMYDLGGIQGAGFFSDDPGSPLYVHDNTFFNGGDNGFVVTVGDGNANSIISNNNFYNTGTCINNSNETGTFRNNCCFGSALAFSNIGAATGRNNYADDGSCANGNWAIGSGNQINQVAANGFQSLTNTDSNFLDIIKGGIFDGAGATNDAAIARTFCGRGRKVPGPNGTSVGVAERAFGGGGPVKLGFNIDTQHNVAM